MSECEHKFDLGDPEGSYYGAHIKCINCREEFSFRELSKLGYLLIKPKQPSDEEIAEFIAKNADPKHLDFVDLLLLIRAALDKWGR